MTVNDCIVGDLLYLADKEMFWFYEVVSIRSNNDLNVSLILNHKSERGGGPSNGYLSTSTLNEYNARIILKG